MAESVGQVVPLKEIKTNTEDDQYHAEVYEAPLLPQYIKPPVSTDKKRPAEDLDDNESKKPRLDEPTDTRLVKTEEGPTEVKTEEEKGKRERTKGKKKNKPLKDFGPKLCSHVAKSQECPNVSNNKCKDEHDLKKYLDSKVPDISDKCYVFETKGYCRYGHTCRFASGHHKENVVPQETTEINSFNQTLRNKLWNNMYEFPRSEQVFKEEKIKTGFVKKKSNKFTKHKSPTTTKGGDQVSATDIEVVKIAESYPKKEPRLKTKKDWENKLYLAPLTTIGNLPYRRIVKRFGVDITCGEMGMGTSLLQGHPSEFALLRRHASEDLFGVQITGGFTDQLTRCAEMLSNEFDVDFVDLNAGCPLDLVCTKGAGAQLLEKHDRLLESIKCMSKVSDVPITLKLRIGKDERCPTSLPLFKQLAQHNCSAVTLHGRSRRQRYAKLADWKYIDACAREDPNLPVFGNGDIYTSAEYEEHTKNTAVTGVMLARGAIIKPWLPTEIKEQKVWDISASERLDIMRDFANYGLEHWGSDFKGVETTRSFFLNWQSFLYRYVPVGLLERTDTIRMNMRVPSSGILGRSELETLLASPLVSDWVKISEMFLGKAPTNFVFHPKHKANSESNG
eukprot:TRINITY_DN1877_c0_g1_i1.p1 TRINITY_DN1877_c0_g1~~TRINITY_DN1877_c0_g1_i1.p1  ORF type:complete len:619 (-),score=125.50 TRINITY_DN1877_c0_g1_i1:49-1905(-)